MVGTRTLGREFGIVLCHPFGTCGGGGGKGGSTTRKRFACFCGISLRRRRKQTPVSTVCEAAQRSLFWTPNGVNELPELRFEFPFSLIDYYKATNQSCAAHVLRVDRFRKSYREVL